jgi:hypothetical protein
MEASQKETLRLLIEQKLSQSKPPYLFEPTFPQQENFYKDPAKLKCLFCTRRAAKSYTLGLCAVTEALRFPNSNILLIGLTRASAKGIFWKDILKAINKKFNLRGRLGRKYRWVGIDEGSLYTINLRHFIYDILKPAMADERGTIALAGTSSNFTQGLFFDITKGSEQGWSVHTWSAHDNPFIAKQWAEELEEIRTLRPLYMETPQYRQWFLNEWVIELDKLVYKFSHDRNIFKELPYSESKGWTFNLGVDVGWEDDNAFVLSGYHVHDPALYVIRVFKKNHMYFDHTDPTLSVRHKIKEFLADPRYPISQVIIDGANKQGVETMNTRGDIPFYYADKQSKVDHIEMCNGDLIQGKIKIHTSCTPLIDEMMALVWKTAGDKIILPKKEHPSLPNHACDAFLYGWYNGWHFLSKPAKIALIPGSPEYIREQEDLHKKSIAERLQREQMLKDPNARGITWVKDRNGRDPWNNWD